MKSAALGSRMKPYMSKKSGASGGAAEKYGNGNRGGGKRAGF